MRRRAWKGCRADLPVLPGPGRRPSLSTSETAGRDPPALTGAPNLFKMPSFAGHSKVEGKSHEADLSAQQPEEEAHPRIPRPDADTRWPPSHQSKKGTRQEARRGLRPHRLAGSSGRRTESAAPRISRGFTSRAAGRRARRSPSSHCRTILGGRDSVSPSRASSDRPSRETATSGS